MPLLGELMGYSTLWKRWVFTGLDWKFWIFSERAGNIVMN